MNVIARTQKRSNASPHRRLYRVLCRDHEKRACRINSRKRRNATALLLFRADSCPFSPLSRRKRTKKRNSYCVLGVPRSADLGSGRCPDTPPPFEKGGRKLLGLFATACFARKYECQHGNSKTIQTVRRTLPRSVLQAVRRTSRIKVLCPRCGASSAFISGKAASSFRSPLFHLSRENVLRRCEGFGDL